MRTPGVVQSFLYRIDSLHTSCLPSQDGFEICYLHSGTCCYYVDPDFYQLEEGDLFISGGPYSGTLGMFLKSGCTRTNIRFSDPNRQEMFPTSLSIDLLAPFRPSKTCRWKLNRDRKIEIESIFNKMSGCRLHTNPFSVNRFHHAFFDLLLFLCEINDESNRPSSEQSKTKEAHVRQIVSYVGDHYGEELTLDLLAGIVNLNKYYAGKLFREITGMTVFEYIKKRRVVEARRLLILDPDRSVTDISLEVGFKQLSHFSSSFKQITGQSPEQFRRSHLAGAITERQSPVHS